MAGDHLELDGEVIEVLCGKFKVLINGTKQEVMAQLSGKMRQNKIRVVLGDGVTVKVSPYDLSKGFIVSRN